MYTYQNWVQNNGIYLNQQIREVILSTHTNIKQD